MIATSRRSVRRGPGVLGASPACQDEDHTGGWMDRRRGVDTLKRRRLRQVKQSADFLIRRRFVCVDVSLLVLISLQALLQNNSAAAAAAACTPTKPPLSSGKLNICPL